MTFTRERNEQSITHGLADYPGEKYTNATGIPALIEQRFVNLQTLILILTSYECSTEEGFKSSSFIPDVVLSNDFSKTPFQRAYKFEGSLWDAYERYPGRLQRIQATMVGFANMRPHQSRLEGWSYFSMHHLVTAELST